MLSFNFIYKKTLYSLLVCLWQGNSNKNFHCVFFLGCNSPDFLSHLVPLNNKNINFLEFLIQLADFEVLLILVSVGISGAHNHLKSIYSVCLV